MTRSRNPERSAVGSIQLAGEGTIQLSEKSPDGVAQLSELRLTGVGTVTSRPNQVTLTVGHTTLDKDPATSQAKNDKVMGDVVKALKALGVLDKDVRTVTYGVQPHYVQVRRRKGGTQTVVTKMDGYQTVHVIAATSHDVDRAGHLITVGTGSGASENGGIQFGVDTKTTDRLKLEAIKAAMRQAKEKAEVALKFCGRKIVSMEPVSVDEEEGRPYATRWEDSAPAIMRASVREAEEAPVEAGSVNVTARVMLLFKF